MTAIKIRPIQTDDAPLIFAAARESVAEVSRWLPWCHPDYRIEETIEYVSTRRAAWAEGREFSFAIVEAETGHFLGGVGLNQINRIHHMANLGYWVRTSAVGRGAATAATRQTARFGLGALGLQRIEIVAAVGNLASQRVAEKAGAKREGILRKRLLIHGEALDAVMFSLTAEDLAAMP